MMSLVMMIQRGNAARAHQRRRPRQPIMASICSYLSPAIANILSKPSCCSQAERGVKFMSGSADTKLLHASTGQRVPAARRQRRRCRSYGSHDRVNWPKCPEPGSEFGDDRASDGGHHDDSDRSSHQIRWRQRSETVRFARMPTPMVPHAD